MTLKRFLLSLGMFAPAVYQQVHAENLSVSASVIEHTPNSLNAVVDDTVYSSTLSLGTDKDQVAPIEIPKTNPLPTTSKRANTRQIIGSLPTDDLWTRMRSGFQLPDMNDPLVQQHIDWYAARPELVKRITQRGGKYLHYIVEECERRGLPTELALLPFIESAYNPRAQSPARASGLWQFIPGTGKQYNLKQNGWQDERRDIVASTNAALDYLTYLRDFQEGDWHLAIASYNWGEGAVKRAVNKNKDRGAPADFTSLKMPKETRNYVPKLLAVKAIIADPTRYGVELPAIENAPYFAAFTLGKDVDVHKVASVSGVPVDELKDLNPSFRLGMLPGSHNPRLLIPVSKAVSFQAKLEEGVPLSNWQVHVTQAGDKLETVAQRYGMSVEQLRQANNLSRSSRVSPGRSLLVTAGGVPLTVATQTNNTNTLNNNQTVNEAPKIEVAKVELPKQAAQIDQITTPTKTKAQSAYSPAQNRHAEIANNKKVPIQVANNSKNTAKTTIKYHVVKPGETLTGIAAKYDVAKNDILEDNKIPKGLVQRGQKLKIVIDHSDNTPSEKIQVVEKESNKSDTKAKHTRSAPVVITKVNTYSRPKVQYPEAAATKKNTKDKTVSKTKNSKTTKVAIHETKDRH